MDRLNLENRDIVTNNSQENQNNSSQERAFVFLQNLRDKVERWEISTQEFNQIELSINDFLQNQNNEIIELNEEFLRIKNQILQESSSQQEHLSNDIELERLWDYFNIDIPKIIETQSIISTYEQHSNLDMWTLELRWFLSKYKDFIEENLSNIENREIVDKVKSSIWLRTLQIWDKINESIRNISSSYPAREVPYQMRRERWIIDENISDLFSFVDTQLLPTAVLINKIDNWDIILPNESELYISTRRWTRPKRWERYEKGRFLLRTVQESREMFASQLNNDGTFQRWFTSFFNDNWDILNWVDDGNSFFSNNRVNQVWLFEELWIQTIDTPSILNESEMQLKADILIKLIAFIMTMLVPYAWVISSIPSDIYDIFSTQDWVIRTMQMYWLIPDDFKMSWEWYDSILWWVWLAWSLIWWQALSRWPRMARLRANLRTMWVTENEMTQRLSHHMQVFSQRFASNNPDNIANINSIQRDNIWDILRVNWIENARLIETPSWPRLDLSDLSSQELETINRIMTNNFPLMEITRLPAWQTIVNINISWIKQINDIAWQHFTDMVLNRFREIVIWNARNNTNSRLVKSDYKNTTFVSNDENIWDIIFWDFNSKSQLIQRIIDDLESSLRANWDSIIRNAINEWKITWVVPGSYEFNRLVEENITNTQDVIRTYFNFWIWRAEVPEWESQIWALEAIRRAESSSRPRAWSDMIEIKEYNHSEIIDMLRSSNNIREDIINRFRNSYFDYNWLNYRAVVNIDWEFHISNELLRYARKYPDKINPEELSNLVTQYIRDLNNSLDFIAPSRWEITPSLQDFNRAQDLNRQIRDRMIDPNALTNTFKWWLTREAFNHRISWEVWTSVFVDIKDMWIDNIVDFQNRSQEILRIQRRYDAWEIDIQTYNDLTQRLFLEAWKSVTDKFVEANRLINERYPNAIISFWGDEIFLFIPNNTHTPSISQDLNNIFASSWQQARMTITSWIGNAENFNQLDRLTWVNKFFEEWLEWIFIRNGENLELLPNSTNLFMSRRFEEAVFNQDISLNDFLNQLKNSPINNQSWNLLIDNYEISYNMRRSTTNPSEISLDININ